MADLRSLLSLGSSAARKVSGARETLSEILKALMWEDGAASVCASWIKIVLVFQAAGKCLVSAWQRCDLIRININTLNNNIRRTRLPEELWARIQEPSSLPFPGSLAQPLRQACKSVL